MKIKFKKTHERARSPTKADVGSAGLDMVAVSKDKQYNTDGTLAYIEYSTGLAFEIPEGYVGLVFPRSSISKYDLSLANSVGIIDSSYRGTVTFRFKPHTFVGGKQYEISDKIGQIVIMPYPEVYFDEVEELNETSRGEGSYGSSGR